MIPLPSLRNLEMLGALLENRNLTQTARLVGLTQPAVSLALKEMECQFGFPLFTRGSRALVPTTEALALARRIEDVITQVKSLGEHAAELRDDRAGQLRFSSVLAMTAAVLPRAVAQLRVEQPRIRIEMLVDTVDRVIDRVKRGIAELGFIYTAAPEPGITAEPLLETTMVCVLDQSHPLTAKRTLDIDDLSSSTAILPSANSVFGSQLRDLARELHGSRHGSIEVNNVFSALALVRAGLGIAVLDPLLLCAPHVAGLVARPLQPSITARLMMICAPHQPESRLAPRFMRHVRVAIATEVEVLHGLGLAASAF